MDDSDRKILELLTADSRRSLADIGGFVGLSTSSVNDRIRRLVTTGTIRRFTVDLDPFAIGMNTLALVWVALREDADEQDFKLHARQHAAVLECHHVTGSWSYLIKLRVRSMPDVEAFLAELKHRKFLGRSETMLALSSPVEGAVVLKEGSAWS